jgi:acyl dehydratase
VDEDQTFRYAEASGDHNPIHLDAEFARGAAGLPGIIVHGMCTMAFAARAVVDGACGGDPARLRRIRVRFSRPVFPGEALTTRGWAEEGGDDLDVFAFETLNARGNAVITAGVAAVLPATG